MPWSSRISKTSASVVTGEVLAVCSTAGSWHSTVLQICLMFSLHTEFCYFVAQLSEQCWSFFLVEERKDMRNADTACLQLSTLI